ncbi:Imm50 family immunity protein [Sphingobium sp. AP49]|uniref:Imm50 family immunity protein n=1 Tax=Sphingobium sp. AP49 TaxID=1144307 RepID=UPI0009DB0CD7|nr:Imm50 family immunity protein [Sphingobium sp. AP49]WHO38399.1 Imm50 family immunity protein [Sphingobium sp. AP49]
MSDIINIPGTEKIVEWFGYMPNFHDSEVEEIILRRDPEASFFSLICWRSSVPISGSDVYNREKEVVVVFRIGGISQINLNDWNHQNVLSKVEISKTDDGYRIDLLANFGLDGFIVADDVSVSLRHS